MDLLPYLALVTPTGGGGELLPPSISNGSVRVHFWHVAPSTSGAAPEQQAERQDGTEAVCHRLESVQRLG